MTILHRFGDIRANFSDWELPPVRGMKVGEVKQATTCTLFVGCMSVKCVQYEARMLNGLAIEPRRLYD